MWWVCPGWSTGPEAPYCHELPSPTKTRTSPDGPVLSHQPVKSPCVAQIVRLSGSAVGRTSTSIENPLDGVHAAAPPCVLAVAPEMSTHAAPEVLQRRH